MFELFHSKDKVFEHIVSPTFMSTDMHVKFKIKHSAIIMEEVNTSKFLSMHLDQRLTCNYHIDAVLPNELQGFLF